MRSSKVVGALSGEASNLLPPSWEEDITLDFPESGEPSKEVMRIHTWGRVIGLTYMSYPRSLPQKIRRPRIHSTV